MSLISITYIGPFDAVEIDWPVDARTVVKRGGTVELPARVAGRVPEGDDPGEGFLAQSSIWQLTEAPKASKTKGEG